MCSSKLMTELTLKTPQPHFNHIIGPKWQAVAARGNRGAVKKKVDQDYIGFQSLVGLSTASAV